MHTNNIGRNIHIYNTRKFTFVHTQPASIDSSVPVGAMPGRPYPNNLTRDTG